MCYANGSSKWHTPAYYIWHCLLKARKLGSQPRNGMAEFSSVTKEEQSSYTTDVRLADLKATLN